MIAVSRELERFAGLEPVSCCYSDYDCFYIAFSNQERKDAYKLPKWDNWGSKLSYIYSLLNENPIVYIRSDEQPLFGDYTFKEEIWTVCSIDKAFDEEDWDLVEDIDIIEPMRQDFSKSGLQDIKETYKQVLLKSASKPDCTSVKGDERPSLKRHREYSKPVYVVYVPSKQRLDRTYGAIPETVAEDEDGLWNLIAQHEVIKATHAVGRIRGFTMLTAASQAKKDKRIAAKSKG